MSDPLIIGGVIMRALSKLEGHIVQRHCLRFRTVSFNAQIILTPRLGQAGQAEPAPQGRPVEENILEAIGSGTLFAPEIAKRAGYKLSTYFRDTLRKLVREKLLEKTAEGYRRTVILG